MRRRKEEHEETSWKVKPLHGICQRDGDRDIDYGSTGTSAQHKTHLGPDPPQQAGPLTQAEEEPETICVESELDGRRLPMRFIENQSKP